MLIELLMHLSESKGIFTITELARELKVSEGNLRMLIDEAARLGYLADLSAAGQEECSSTCHCSGCNGCPANKSKNPPTWEITEKGHRLLAGRKV